MTDAEKIIAQTLKTFQENDIPPFEAAITFLTGAAFVTGRSVNPAMQEVVIQALAEYFINSARAASEGRPKAH